MRREDAVAIIWENKANNVYHKLSPLWLGVREDA